MEKLEHIGIAAQSNVIRAAAALPLGFTAAWIVIAMLMTAGTQPRASSRQPAAGSSKKDGVSL